MKRKLVAFAFFAAWCTLVGVGSTMGQWAKVADLILLCVHLGAVLLLSVSLLRERLYGSRRGKESLLRRWRRWVTDDAGLT